MPTAEFFAEDLRAAVDKHEANYREAYGRHRYSTLDIVEARRLKDLGIQVKLPRTATAGPTRIAVKKEDTPRKAGRFVLPTEPTWVKQNDTQWVDSFVEDVDLVAPDGVIRIFTGEAEPNLYNHPLVMEAMVRAARPGEAFLSHSKRGANMVNLRRYQDAAYDFQYAEFLADRMGFKVGRVRRMAPEVRQHLNSPLGDIFGRFGFTLMALNLPEQARPRLERALGHSPRQEYVNHNLGQCLRVLGEPTDLVAKYYRRELKLNPAHPTAAQDLAGIKS